MRALILSFRVNALFGQTGETGNKRSAMAGGRERHRGAAWERGSSRCERAKEPRRYPFADGLPIEGEASEVSRIVPRSERKSVLSASDAPQIAA